MDDTFLNLLYNLVIHILVWSLLDGKPQTSWYISNLLHRVISIETYSFIHTFIHLLMYSQLTTLCKTREWSLQNYGMNMPVIPVFE